MMSMNEDTLAPEPRGAREEANFVANMRRLREEQGWSQGEMAKRMQDAGWSEFHQTTISRIEKGSRPVRLGEARGIAGVFGALVGQMILDSEVAEKLRNLELDLMKLRDIGWSVGSSAVEYLVQKSVVEYALDQQPSVPDSADESMKVRHTAVMETARQELTKKYTDYIDAAMEAHYSDSTFINGEDVSDLSPEELVGKIRAIQDDAEA